MPALTSQAGLSGKSPARPHKATAVLDPASTSKATQRCHCSPHQRSTVAEHTGAHSLEELLALGGSHCSGSGSPQQEMPWKTPTAEHISTSAKARAPRSGWQWEIVSTEYLKPPFSQAPKPHFAEFECTWASVVAQNSPPRCHCSSLSPAWHSCCSSPYVP